MIDPAGSDVQEEAARWWARMHAPDAERSREMFERWRAANPAHAAEYAALERTWDLAAGLRATEVARARPLSRRPLSWATPPRLALAAAAIVVAICLVALQPFGAGSSPIVAVAHATEVGQIRSFTLPDGSRVTLDTDSKVRVRFDGAARRVELERGRARFEVRPEKERPFLVSAAGRTVSASSATFDVALLSRELCVSALRGAVDVTGRDGAGGARLGAKLAAGQVARISLSGSPPIRSEAAGEGSDEWVSGMLVFRGAPLSAVLDQTNRYSHRRILLGAPALGDFKVTGGFRPAPADELAASLAAAFDLHVESDSQGNLVLVRR